MLYAGLLLIVACSRKTVLIAPQLMKVENVVIDNFRSPCEPSIAIDPTNTDHILAASVLDNVYESIDAGKTWTKSKLKSPYGVYGDPVVRIDAKGQWYYAHLSNPKGRAYASEEFLDRIVIQQKNKTSGKWDEGSFPPSNRKKDHDKHWYSFDPNDNTILMSWTEFDKYASTKLEDKSRILFSKSSDNGITWTSAVDIAHYEGDCIDDDMTTEGAVPVVGIDGKYHVVWSFNNAIYINTSSDQGATWQAIETKIFDQPGGWSYDIPGIDRCNGMPFVNINRAMGTKHYGRIYINWSDQRKGVNDTDIWLAYTDNAGKTWSEPTRVNNDATKTHQFMSSMTVDQSTGYIYVVFYDRCKYTDTNTDVTLAISTNGGVSFENVIISEKPFLPTKEGVFFGDYTDISAEQGKIRPIWTRQDGKALSVLTALVDVK